MQTRVRPRGTIYNWQVEVLDPYNDKWETVSLHDFFWYANMKAKWLSKKSLRIHCNKKEEFLGRLKGTYKKPNKGAMGAPP